MGPVEPPPGPVRPRRGRRARQPCQRRRRRPAVDGDVQAGDPRVQGQLDATPRQRRSRQAEHPVRLVCASATGYYGERGDEPLTEESPTGHPRSSPTSSPPGRPRRARGGMPARRSPLPQRHRAGPRRTDVAAADARPVRARRADGRGRQFMALDHPRRRGRRDPAPARPPGDHGSGQPRQRPSPAGSATSRGAGDGALHRPSVFPAPRFALRMVSASSPARSSAGKRIVG